MSTPADPLLPFAPIRTVGVPHAPFDGLLARGSDGETVHLVDRDELVGWEGWRFEPDEHVLTPIDLVRRADGHDVVFPVVTDRLDRFLARRAATAPLGDGELVTLAVSVLRGLAAVLDAAERAQWWLTDEGRPILVAGIGDADARRSSAAVLAQAGEDAGASAADILTALAESAASARRPAQLADAEQMAFSLAAPEPLATAVLASARPARAHGTTEADALTAESRPWWLSLASRFDGELTDHLERLRTRRRRRDTGTPSRRRLPLLVAVGAAAVVVTGGLLWPEGGDAGAEPMAPASSAAPSPSAPEATVASPAPDATAPDAAVPEPVASPTTAATPEAVLAHLLDERAACVEDDCRALVLEDPARALAAGAIDLSAQARAITLVDDLGGLVVLRVEAVDATTPPQLVTIVDTPNGWRVRDVFDVADPPGSR